MKIGISVNLDVKKNRGGIERYVSQLIQNLMMLNESKEHQFFLYNRKNLNWPFRWGWTQIRLSWEMFRNKPDVLFVPSHTFPLIHPKKIVVTIQGLEYERAPKYYSLWQRKKLRFLTKRNSKKATKIIVPSKCTKNDLVKLYKINPEKIFVVYHGIEKKRQRNKETKYIKKIREPHILYLGSEHKRKNIEGLKKVCEILKEKYKIPHKLILAGVKQYINEEKKEKLLSNADVFVFLSFYEGFGFPVLEAQSRGVPVVSSNKSSLPEILGNSALLVNPNNFEETTKRIYDILTNKSLRDNLIKKGYNNIKQFSWQNCAKETLKIICE